MISAATHAATAHESNGLWSFIIGFDEGRTLPNLLGCLLSRRLPVHASESWAVGWPVFFHLFGAILNDVTISLRKAFCVVLCCWSDVLEGSSFIAVWSVSYFVMLLKNFVGVIYQSVRKECATSGPCTSTRTCFVLNGSRCLIELTRCGRKSNQPSSVAWPLCQLKQHQDEAVHTQYSTLSSLS